MPKKHPEVNENLLETYFDQIKQYPLLSFDEELSLSKKIIKGDANAKEILIKSNLRLVVKIAKGFLTPDMNLLDLVQEGNLGLIKAAGKYDYHKNVRFSTYASWWIKQSITRALSNKRRAIRLPHRKEEALKKIQKTYNSLSQSYMRKPTTEEIATELKMPVQEVNSVLNLSSTIASLDSELSVDSGTLLDVCEDTTYNPEREYTEKAVREQTMKFLEHLLDKERQILLYRFAFYGGKKYTLKRIGEEMGISPETVRQIELRAIRKLKVHAEELKHFVYH